MDQILNFHIQGAPKLILNSSKSSLISNKFTEPEMAPAKTLLNKRKILQQKQNSTNNFIRSYLNY